MTGKAANSKAGKKVNKSKAIVKYYVSHPEAKPREIVDVLKRRGIHINAQYVSTILFNYRKKVDRIDNGSVQSRPRAKETGSIAGVSAREIILAKQLVKQSGSIGAARKALELYSDIIA